MTSSKIIALVIINNRGDNYMINVKVIGKIIKKMSENKGLTQEVLSGLAWLDRTHYSKIERGLRSPTIETLFKIADALDIEPHEIMIEIEKSVNERM